MGPPLQIGASPEQVWKVLQDAKSPMFVILHVGLPILVRQTGERGHELLFVGEMLIHMGVQLSGEGGHFGIVHVVFEEELAFEPLQQLKQLMAQQGKLQLLRTAKRRKRGNSRA